MHAYVSVPMPVGGIEVVHAYLSVPTPRYTCMSVPGPSLGRACGAFVCVVCAVCVCVCARAPYVLCIHTRTYDTYEILICKQYVINLSLDIWHIRFWKYAWKFRKYTIVYEAYYLCVS